MQQGRVLVDADWNSAAGTSLWAQRALAADIIGPHGGPNGLLGFTPTLVEHGGHIDLELSSGVYYVDGIRCELHASLVPPGHGGMSWTQQPYPTAVELEDLPPTPYLVYLDVWERLVTDLEDDALRDAAITGVGTTRRQVISQVWVTPWRCHGGEPTSDTFPLEGWRKNLRADPPRLRATTQPIDTPDGLGDDPDTGFRGAENHLYRVEIASDGTGGDPPYSAGLETTARRRRNGLPRRATDCL
jgi:hypothetical protein